MYGDNVKMIKSVMLMMIMFCIFPIEYTVHAEDTPDELKELYARSAVLMDADSGRILFGKNESEIMPMASTTKIMTCILALENLKPDQTVVVSENAARQPEVHLGMNTGETYLIMDLLYSLMLESHNDSAVAIAEKIGGSVEGFADMMNKKALEIGCKNTYFITPNGLDKENKEGVHSTTASDLALIMRYCIQQSPQKEQFLEISRKKEYEFCDISGKRRFICHNHNLFLDMMEGALAGKTGFTNNAGYCYVGALRRDERTYIVALLACGWPGNKTYKWKDTIKLMEYALANYEYKTVSIGKDFGNIKIINGVNKNYPFRQQEHVKVSVQKQMESVKILMKDDEEIETKLIKNNYVEAPVSKGQKVGNMYYMLNGHLVLHLDIVTTDSVKDKNIRYMWAVICREFFS